MGRFLFLLASSLSFAAGVDALLPSPEVDFLIVRSESYAVCSGKRLGLLNYSVVPSGKNLYTLRLLFRGGKPPKTEKVLFFKVEFGYPSYEKSLEFQIWYRGGRFAFPLLNGKVLTLWDLSPKCVLKREGDYLVPRFGKLRRRVNLGGCEVNLVFTFTRCDF